MRHDPVFVSAVGMACPLGLTWAAACAAMRAGLTRKTVSRYSDNRGREIVASCVRGVLAEDELAAERWLFLLACALRELTRGAGAPRLADTPMFLALPDSLAGRPPTAASVADALSEQLAEQLAADHVHIFGQGAYGGFLALQQGRACARARRPCVVAAADSLLSAGRMLAASERQRLLVEDNPDGFIPGEAAAAMVLTREPHGTRACIRGLGFAREPSRLDNDVPLRAEGLIEATRAALREAGSELHELDLRVSGAAGESFYFKEQALLVARLLREPKASFPLWLPAETLADTGAAAGLCGMLWVMAGWERGYAPGPRAIGFASNDEGNRAAAVFETRR